MGECLEKMREYDTYNEIGTSQFKSQLLFLSLSMLFRNMNNWQVAAHWCLCSGLHPYGMAWSNQTRPVLSTALLVAGSYQPYGIAKSKPTPIWRAKESACSLWKPAGHLLLASAILFSAERVLKLVRVHVKLDQWKNPMVWMHLFLTVFRRINPSAHVPVLNDNTSLVPSFPSPVVSYSEELVTQYLIWILSNPEMNNIFATR